MKATTRSPVGTRRCVHERSQPLGRVATTEGDAAPTADGNEATPSGTAAGTEQPAAQDESPAGSLLLQHRAQSQAAKDTRYVDVVVCCSTDGPPNKKLLFRARLKPYYIP